MRLCIRLAVKVQVVTTVAKDIKNLLCKHVLGVFGFRQVCRFFSESAGDFACIAGFFCCQKATPFVLFRFLRYTNNEGTARYITVKVPKEYFEKNILRPRNALHACAQGRVLARRRRGAGSLQLFEQGLAAGENILVGGVEIAGVPGIGDIAIAAGKTQELD